MNFSDVRDIVSILGPIATFVAVGVAAFVYWKNSRLERAKWLATLYEKFYEKDGLKEIREILDCDDDVSLEITNLIRQEPSKFTDYLNFFEFVAFLKKSKQLKIDEIDDLFGYYLDCLSQREEMREYVSKRGYELLAQLLLEFSEKRK